MSFFKIALYFLLAMTSIAIPPLLLIVIPVGIYWLVTSKRRVDNLKREREKFYFVSGVTETAKLLR